MLWFWQYTQGPGIKQKIPFWGRWCFDLCGCCTASFMAQNDAKSYLLHQLRYSTEAGFMKHILSWIFLSRVWVGGRLMARRQLHKLLKRHVGCCPCWSFSLLVALVGIGNRSNSQIIGSIENLGGCAWESSSDLFKVDLVSSSAIFRLSAQNFAHR